jgi:hypothetical protein
MDSVVKKILLGATALALTINQGLADPMCLVRDYDKAHLAKHPEQTITSMTLVLDDHGHFTAAFRLRGDQFGYVQTGYHPEGTVGPDGMLHYIVECDGGVLDIMPTGTASHSAALVYFDFVSTVRADAPSGGLGCPDIVEPGYKLEINGKVDNSPVKLFARPNRDCGWLNATRDLMVAREPKHPRPDDESRS